MDWFNNSKLFELAKQGQRLTHIAAIIPLAFLFVVISQLGVIPIVVAMGVLYGFTESGISTPNLSTALEGFWMAMQLFFTFGSMYLILWAWLKFFEKRSFWTLGYEIKNAVKQYTRGFLFGVLMFFGAVAILSMFGSVG